MIESILKGFEVWTDAKGVKSKGRVKSIDNISLEGIARLRELILSLAIQGKLSSQDDKDIPAFKLFEDITLPEPKPDQKYFELPKKWIWVRNDILFKLVKGKKPKNISEEPIGYPYLDIDALDRNIYKQYSTETNCPMSRTGDILVVCDGSRSGLVLKGQNGIIGSTLALIDAKKEFQPYIELLFMKLFKELNSSVKGAAIPHLDTKRLLSTFTAIPPIEEQHRIVAKVNELMALCDRLEEQQANNLNTQHNLVKSLLETLTRANDVDELQTAWAKLSEHFDTLFCTEDSIEQLRQALFELVVAGRFKTQNDTDTPASVTFVNIKEELAERHGKEYLNKLKRDMSTIEPSNFHFPIPESWIWCELQDLAILFNGKAHEQFVDENGDYVLVNSSFVSSEGKVAKFVSSQLTPLVKGNIAIVMSDVPGGKALVKCYLVEENDKYSLNQRIGGIDASSHIDIRYLFLVLNRNKYYLQYDDGKKQTNLKKIQILSCPVPLPPIEEQERILNKWNELLEICNKLKARLNTANEINVALSNSIMTVV